MCFPGSLPAVLFDIRDIIALKTQAAVSGKEVMDMDGRPRISLFAYPSLLVKSTVLTLLDVSAVCFVTLFFSRYTDMIVDERLTGKSIYVGLFCYVLLEAGIILVNYLYGLGTAHIVCSLSIRIRDSLLDLILGKCTAGDFDEAKKDRFSSVFVNDIESLRKQYFEKQLSVIRVLLRYVAYLSLMFYYGFRLGIWTLVLSAVLLFFSVRSSRSIDVFGRRLTEGRERYLKKYQDCLKSRPDYKYSVKDYLLKAKMEEANDQMEAETYFCGRQKVRVSMLNYGVICFTRCMVIGVDILLAFSSNLSVGAIIASFSLLSLIEDAVNEAQSIIVSMAETKAAKVKVLDLMQSLLAMPAPAEWPERSWRKFGFENVSIDYNEEALLRNAGMEFEKGKKYLIVGKSGCGKSTALKLLTGAIGSGGGRLFVDDDRYPPGSEAILSFSAYLEQDFHLFDDTIENNIYFGSPERKERLRETGFTEFISRYISDIHERVVENGANLSGGQRQVIGIARALSGGRQVLILDESFSALDQKAADDIIAFLTQIREITLIAVSHRKLQDSGFDCRYEIRGGRIYEKRGH